MKTLSLTGRLRPRFDPFQLLAWFIETRWTSGASVLAHASNIAPREERHHYGSAATLVVAATGWLHENGLIEWREFAGNAPLTRSELEAINLIWVTSQGYDAMAARGTDQFSGAIAPIMLAFTVPTVALVVTTDKWAVQPSSALRLWLALLFTMAGGLLLVAFQCSVGSVRRLVTNTVRAIVTTLGVGFLWAGLVVFVAELLRRSGTALEVLAIAAMSLITASVVIPLLLRMREWHRHGTAREVWAATVAEAGDDVRPRSS